MTNKAAANEMRSLMFFRVWACYCSCSFFVVTLTTIGETNPSYDHGAKRLQDLSRTRDAVDLHRDPELRAAPLGEFLEAPPGTGWASPNGG